MEHFTQFRIVLALCAALAAAASPSARAYDNPAQATAREALMQRLTQPDRPQNQPLPTTNPPAVAVSEQRAELAADLTEAVPENTASPQTVTVATTPPVMAPAMVASASVASVPVAAPAVAPVEAKPAVSPVVHPAAVASTPAAPAISPVTLLLVLIGLLLIALVVMVVLLLKLRALKLMLLKNPAVMARAEEAARRRDAR